MNVLILTAADDTLTDFCSRTDVSKREYAEKWKYDFENFKIKNIPDTHPSWQKIQILLDRVNLKKYDYIVWLDSDIIITNYTVDISTLFSPKYALTFPEDWCAPPGYNPTSRWFSCCSIIVNCSHNQTKVILEKASTQTQYRNRGCWDQDAMHAVINRNPTFNSCVHRVPRRVLNAVDKDITNASEPWKHGDFLIHLTGLGSYENRIPKIDYYMENRIC